MRDINLRLLNNNQFSSNDDRPYICELNKINIFIGGNNSGKSRFLRSLMIALPKIINEDKNILTKTNENGTLFLKRLKFFIEHSNVKIVNNREDELKEVINNKSKNVPHGFLYDLANLKINVSDTPIDSGQLSLINEINRLAKGYLNNNNQTFIIESELHFKYIPILRGLKPLTKLDKNYVYDDIYSKRIIEDYKDVKNVFSGLELFEEIKKRLLGDEKERQIISDFEDFISSNLFGERVTLIPKYGDDILNIKIGKDQQMSIVDLGDGLQALICILFPIFLEKDKEYYFFIEEPELNLHPQLQKKLISLLSAPIFNQHQYFITTHSAHIIDHENASVYNFTKKDDKTIITHLDNQSKIVSALNTMGYTPSDLLQTNFIIWVEGPSDKIYINYLIKETDHTLQENLHYSIMFYNGSTGKYLFDEDIYTSMIFSLNRNCVYICDSDRQTKNCTTNKHLKTKSLVKNLNDAGYYAWMTPYREFENHIDSKIFLQAVKWAIDETSADLVNDDIYADRFLVKTDGKKNKSPKQSIRLTNKLFGLITSKEHKNNLEKIDIDIIKTELQESINQTMNEIVQKIDSKHKVPIAEFIVNNGFKPDSDLEKMIKELISRIKKVNNLK